MNVSIRGENIKITDNLQDYAETKLRRLDRYLPNISEVHVDLERERTRSTGTLTIAQITLRHQRGAILRAEEKVQGEDRDSIAAAINGAVDKMYRRIERFKGKRKGHGHKGDNRYFATEEELSLAEDIPEEEYADYEIDQEDEDQVEEVLRRKDVPVIPMTESEAIDQMELLGHSFFMFFNQETGGINVVYRRENGGYGLLVPRM